MDGRAVLALGLALGTVAAAHAAAPWRAIFGRSEELAPRESIVVRRALDEQPSALRLVAISRPRVPLAFGGVLQCGSSSRPLRASSSAGALDRTATIPRATGTESCTVLGALANAGRRRSSLVRLELSVR